MLISSYKVEGEEIRVKSPYCPRIVSDCRSWGGKWDREESVWCLPLTRLEAVQKQLGANLNDLVQVRVTSNDWEGLGELTVGWYLLASRESRDSRAKLYGELVVGFIPSSGGSVKYPSVEPSENAAFQLWVPRDFAEAKNLQIVSSGAPPAKVIFCFEDGRTEEATVSAIPKEIEVGGVKFVSVQETV